jgi:hypothetical protein
VYENNGDGFLRPCLLIRQLDANPFGPVDDAATQVRSVRQVIQKWFYADGDNSYATLESARNQVYALLHRKFVPNASWLRWIGDLDNVQAPEMNNARVLRADYQLVRLKSAT